MNVICAVMERNAGTSTNAALNFMKQYGYLDVDKKKSAAIYSEEELTDALKTVQKFGAIKETGKLDDATLKLMTSPRCGNRDISRKNRTRRSTTGWNKRNLTFYIQNWSSRLGEERVARLIGEALNTWGEYGGLKFSRKGTPDADIIVLFAKGPHNDAFPFDGPGNVLAHAYFPSNGMAALDGDIHFDDDEDWIESTSQTELDSGTEFYQVALHELGHSLGLEHSSDPTAIMFPYYRGTDESRPRLGQHDINAIYQLYVARDIKEWNTYTTEPEVSRPPLQRTPFHQQPTTESSTPAYQPPTQKTTETSRSVRPAPCRGFIPGYEYEDDSLDKYPTPGLDKHNERYPVENEHHFVDENEVLRSENKRHYNKDTKTGTKEWNQESSINDKTNSPNSAEISQVPDICHEKLDGVSNLRGELYVFKNKYLWRFQDKNVLVTGYPTLISHMFRSLPKDIDKVDAAYERPNGDMVLFAGDQYWVYNGVEFVENSPRSISDYGLPLRRNGVDAVQLWGEDGKTYLYMGNTFYIHNDVNRTEESSQPNDLGQWKGVPVNLDGAFTWKDGLTYFIKGNQYWRFENEKLRVSEDSPRSFTREWLGC